MYASCVVATLFIVGIAALPRSDDAISLRQQGATVQGPVRPFFLGPFIYAAVTRYFNNLAANGYDPFETPGPYEHNVQLPDGSFAVHGVYENLRVEGISNVVINRLTTPWIPTRVDFDLIFPQIQIWADPASTAVQFANYNIQSDGSGWASVKDVSITGSADLRLGIPLQVANVNSVVIIGSTQAEVNGSLSGLNGSTNLNAFLNNGALRSFLSVNSAEVNRVANGLTENLVNTILAQS